MREPRPVEWTQMGASGAVTVWRAEDASGSVYIIRLNNDQRYTASYGKFLVDRYRDEVGYQNIGTVDTLEEAKQLAEK